MESNQTGTWPYRFDFNDTEQWLAHLYDKGFVVLSGVVSESDCQKALEQMKKCLATLSPKLTDEESWSKEENYPFLLNGGMVQYVGHANFQWDMREKTAPVFTKIWNCEVTDLAASFDGFCYMNGKRNYNPKHPAANAHTDQSPLKDHLWSIQGLVNLCNSEENDGGLVVIPGSHKIHKEFMNRIGKGDVTMPWYKFTEDEKKMDPIFENYVKVCGRVGDFMMWDSRTFHCNTIPTTENTRAAIYVCEIPKANVPEEIKKEREMAWKQKRCARHHPGDGFKAFPVVPRKANKALGELVPKVSLNDEDLTELQRSLLHT